MLLDGGIDMTIQEEIVIILLRMKIARQEAAGRNRLEYHLLQAEIDELWKIRQQLEEKGADIPF